ncbi:MAG: hypothetical protein ACLUFV_02715 [Acutalibacteraceae bacterium]
MKNGDVEATCTITVKAAAASSETSLRRPPPSEASRNAFDL